jgi:cytochrome bd ubiquinol oxidase subunit II
VNTAAFVLLAAMLAAYVMLDGYDLGVGTLHLILARSDRERAASFAAIGPFWNGNEVFLIAAAAALFALFPKAYAASFSGFYLPFIVLLWLLMVRGMSIELRGHFQSDLWRGFWDVAFSISSALLALVLGVALGNVVRGVPLDNSGYFAGSFAFLLNGYAIAVGALALVALAMHGAAFLWMRRALEPRARDAMRVLVIPVFILFAGVTAATLFVHPVPHSGALWIAPIVAVLSLVAVRLAKRGLHAITASSMFLLALITSAAGTIFPSLLPGFPSGTPGLDIYNSAPGAYSTGTAFTAAAVGFGAVLLYGTLAARRLLGRGAVLNAADTE